MSRQPDPIDGILEQGRLDSLLHTALTEHAELQIPGRSQAVRQRVRAAMTPAPRRHLDRRLFPAVLAAAVALAIATGAAFAAGLLTTRPISELPAAIFQQHFRQQHHGTAGKVRQGPASRGPWPQRNSVPASRRAR